MDLPKKYKRLLWLLGGLIFILIFLNKISDLVVYFIWLKQLGFEQIFWKIKVTEIVLFFGTFIISLVFLGLVIRQLSKGLEDLHFDLGQNVNGMPNHVKISAKVTRWVLYGFIILLSFTYASNISVQWNEWLQMAHSKDFGIKDPVFNLDASFYVFKLPFIETIRGGLVSLSFTALIIVLIFHFAKKGIHFPPDKKWSFNIYFIPEARKQIFFQLGLWLILLASGFYLDRFHLVFKKNSLIDGANYTDVHALLPLYWIMTFGCLMLGILAFLQMRQKKSPRRFIIMALVLMGVNFMGQTLVPNLIQNYQVRPNEFKIEEPYIKKNMDYTRLAYDLEEVEVRQHNAQDSITLTQILNHRDAIKNIRIWDQNLAVETYKQLQEIRLYYEFNNIDLDRYHTSEGYRQVLISVRELSPVLPEKARTWVNQHLQYTHGSGIVMSPTTEKTPEGNPYFYLKDIPPRSDIGLEVKNPAIYYGESKADYKIVNTAISELDYPKGAQNVYTNYSDGRGGIPISNPLLRLLFSWHFNDINILLTNYITKDSKIQFWRDVNTRLSKITPFLTFDDDPYIVLDDGNLFWMHDAYTTAYNFPYSEPYSGRKNYIRNSVKITIDAYHGEVKFYVANPDDPVIKVYRDIFPKLFHDLDEMPGTLKQHIKYPKDLFQIQLEKFSVFHMTDPRVFYNREDLWHRPSETYGGRQIEMEPYYILSKLPGNEKLEYMLISPMTPQNRDNMVSWMVVKSDFPDYGKMIAYELPKESLFLGPAQIEAKINQNTEISRQISLWDQKGSIVIRGNLMVIPIENSFLYVEPVFLFSTTTNIPQLKRIIATTGNKVVMEPTLDDALFALYGQNRLREISSLDSTFNNLPERMVEQLPSPKLKEVRAAWHKMENALQNKDWKKFGEQMDEINQLMKEND